MKKLLIIALLLVSLIGMTACLDEDSSSSKKESQKAENSIPAIELPEDEF